MNIKEAPRAKDFDPQKWQEEVELIPGPSNSIVYTDEFIRTVARRVDAGSVRNVKAVLRCIEETILELLAKENTIILRCFGTFGVKKMKKRVYPNLRNHTSTVEVPEHNAPYFLFGPYSKTQVRGFKCRN